MKKMENQKRLSKMQKLILKTIYDDYTKKPMIRFLSDIKTVDGHIQWDYKNRWRLEEDGSLRAGRLSSMLSKKIPDKRKTFDSYKKSQENYKKYKETGDSHYLLLASFLSKVAKSYRHKTVKSWQTASFRSSFSRSIRRLQNRGLIKVWVFKESNYNYGIGLTPDGEKIARKIKFSECISKETVNNVGGN